MPLNRRILNGIIFFAPAYVKWATSLIDHTHAGNESTEVASRAQQLLEHSLLSELHAVVARALSGLDMFAGHQLSEADLFGADSQDAKVSFKTRPVVPSVESIAFMGFLMQLDE